MDAGDALGGQVGSEAEAGVLRPGIGVVDESGPVLAGAVALPQAHLQRAEHQRGRLAGRRRPADDASGEGVDDECHVHDTGMSSDVGEVGDPDTVWCGGYEDPVEQIRGPVAGRVGDGGADLLAAAGRPGQAQLVRWTRRRHIAEAVARRIPG